MGIHERSINILSNTDLAGQSDLKLLLQFAGVVHLDQDV